MYTRLYSRVEKSRYNDLTVTQASTMRAHHARLAAVYAERVEQARAAGDYVQMGRWIREYKRSAARCRVLGELIRGERSNHERLARGGEREPAPSVARTALTRSAAAA